MVPPLRIRAINEAPLSSKGDYVLYWMIASRRVRYNFALERAVELAQDFDVPLVVLEALRLDYPWASERLHSFILDGMRDNAAALKDSPVAYYPFVERGLGEGKGLLQALAASACAVVTDDFPAFFLPHMISAAGERLPVALEAVDGNGLYPMRATERVFTTAASFRRHLQKELPEHLQEFPVANPLRRRLREGALPSALTRRWNAGIPDSAQVANLDLDHEVGPVKGVSGGERAAQKTLKSFLSERLQHYADARNRPQVDAQSHLSPYLHFGHISAHDVFLKVMRREDWSPERIAPKATGSRRGWWGGSEVAEAFLDELITWRELGYNMCAHRADYAAYSSLPEWAQKTLAEHRDDPRSHRYTLAEFESASTHDELWNAAQRQLVREGTIHNYLRMLWGKKIVEWTRSPQKALEIMVELNNKYALDGRDPNSYSGIFWVLGRYDRAWGPERPVFGKVRYMSSENTARKVRVEDYLERFAE